MRSTFISQIALMWGSQLYIPRAPQTTTSLHCALVAGLRVTRRPVNPGARFSRYPHSLGPWHLTSYRPTRHSRDLPIASNPYTSSPTLRLCCPRSCSSECPRSPNAPRFSRVGGTASRRWRQGLERRRRGRECGGGSDRSRGALRSRWGRPRGSLATRGARGGAEDAPHSPAAAADC